MLLSTPYNHQADLCCKTGFGPWIIVCKKWRNCLGQNYFGTFLHVSRLYQKRLDAGVIQLRCLLSPLFYVNTDYFFSPTLQFRHQVHFAKIIENCNTNWTNLTNSVFLKCVIHSLIHTVYQAGKFARECQNPATHDKFELQNDSKVGFSTIREMYCKY